MAKYRWQEGAFLAEGVKVVRELLKSPWTAEAILVMEGREARWEEIAPYLPHAADTFLLTGNQWRTISQDKEPEGIIAQVSPPSFPGRTDLPESTGHVLLGYGIGNPNNLDALLRTAHWFGVRNIVVGRDSVDILHPKVVRSSMGSLFHLNILTEEDLPALIRNLKPTRRIIGTDPAGGIPPHPLEQPAALILGNESHGLPGEIQSLADECWRIPGTGSAESLSLPQAAAVMIYELTRGG